MMLNNHTCFYKYVTADTAFLILKNRTLKYSSPILFNDPFDTQTKLDYSFCISEFGEALAEELYRLIHLEERPVGFDSAPFFRDIQTIWQKVKEGSIKVPKDAFMRMIQTDMLDEANSAEQIIGEMNKLLMSAVKASRVFCVSEVHDSTVMWSHYAKDHTGAVIEFRLLPELDAPLCAVKKVKYVKKPPVIGNLDEYIKYYTGQGDYPLNKELFYDIYLSKSKHWAYEKEWRVFIPPTDIINPIIPIDENGEALLFKLIPLYTQEVSSIFFGCKMSNEDEEKISKCLTGEFEHVQKYKCIKSSKEYKLEFKQMSV